MKDKKYSIVIKHAVITTFVVKASGPTKDIVRRQIEDRLDEDEDWLWDGAEDVWQHEHCRPCRVVHVKVAKK